MTKSPVEYGEIASSPEAQPEFDARNYRHGTFRGDEDVDIDEDRSHALPIKPPQLLQHRERKHKNKHKTKKKKHYSDVRHRHEPYDTSMLRLPHGCNDSGGPFYSHECDLSRSHAERRIYREDRRMDIRHRSHVGESRCIMPDLRHELQLRERDRKSSSYDRDLRRSGSDRRMRHMGREHGLGSPQEKRSRMRNSRMKDVRVVRDRSDLNEESSLSLHEPVYSAKESNVSNGEEDLTAMPEIPETKDKSPSPRKWHNEGDLVVVSPEESPVILADEYPELESSRCTGSSEVEAESSSDSSSDSSEAGEGKEEGERTDSNAGDVQVDDQRNEEDLNADQKITSSRELDGDPQTSVPQRSKFDDPESDSNDSPVLDEEETVPVEEENAEDESLPAYYPAIMGCRSVGEFKYLNRIEEGTYGVVYRAKELRTGDIVALKRLKMEKEKEGFPITSLREISTLLKAPHINIVTVREIVVGDNMDRIYIVMDFVEHDIKALMETMKAPFKIGEVKCLLLQLLSGVEHLHDNWIVHRDLKTSNLLLSHQGILKIGDFGLAREYGSPLQNYTPIVVTLWYRAPELLLGTKTYSTAVDMWSVGCIMAELFLKKALWQGKSEIEQITKIFKDLGTPNEKIWPGVSALRDFKKVSFTAQPYNILRQRFGAYMSDMGFEIINKFLTYCPSRRISAEEARRDVYFQEEPRAINPAYFPTWPARSEQGSRNKVKTPKPPSGGHGAYAQLLGDNDDDERFTILGAEPQGLSLFGNKI